VVLGAVVVLDPLALLDDVEVDVAAAAMAAPPAARAAVTTRAMNSGFKRRIYLTSLCSSATTVPRACVRNVGWT
jgi:hypothetical protein